MSDVPTQFQPPTEPSGGAPAPAGSGGNRTVIVLSACIGVLVLVIIVGAVLLLRNQDSSVTVSQTASTGSASGTDVTTADGSTLPTGAGASGAGGGNTGGQTGGGGGNASGGATGPTPTITSFKTPDNIDCHNGNSQTFSASWTTTNATKTTISIDGPGIYKTYGPSADESLPFNCSSPHSFTLTAIGSGGKTVTKTITLQPRNVQPPQTTEPGNVAPSTTKAPVSQGTVPSGANKTP